MTRRSKREKPAEPAESRPVPNNFLGLPESASALGASRFVVLPVPFERTTTYKKGTREGPQALIRASHQVEYFDEEIWGEPWRAGIHTAPPFRLTSDTADFVKGLTAEVSAYLKQGKFVITLGGEHAIAEAPVAAYARKFRKLSVLQFDAHADLRATYEGSKYNHACAAYRMMKHAPIVQVGIRNVSETEYQLVNKGKIRTFMMHDTLDFPNHYEAILKALSDTVYITFDLDGFDPAMMPGVGTPVPGGLSWSDALGLIRLVAKRKRLVGADINELSPLTDSVVSEFTAARLVYKIIAYVWAREQKR